MIMERTYNCHRQPSFFTDLFRVYQSGNFPCGWVGEWPQGQLVVF